MSLYSTTSPMDAQVPVTLSSQTTLDRSMVHRAAVSEVFLTDMRRTGETTTEAKAQLPGCHGFFSDHRSEAGLVDPLLLLEIARQATLASAHALGVPQDVILISQNFELSLLTGPLCITPGAPLEVTVDSDFEWTVSRGKQPRHGICRQSILIDGEPVARHWSDGQLMQREQLAFLRDAQRGTPPAWTSDQLPRSSDRALSPVDVARWNPINVVIGYPSDCGRRASISPPWQNRALFDHDYDHLTMQLLTEAARQLATVQRRRLNPAFDPCTLFTVLGCFHQFAEVDAEAHGTSDPAGQRVEIEQDGTCVAEFSLTFDEAGDEGADQ